MLSERGHETVTACTFARNAASISGGAMLIESTALSLRGCRFFANRSLDDGGALTNYDSRPAVGQCTFAAWGPCPAAEAVCPADLDGSGVVDFADVLITLSAWGTCPPGAAREGPGPNRVSWRHPWGGG